MSATHAILAEISSENINLRAEGADLIVEGPESLLTDELLALLRPHKPALLDLLRTWHTTPIFIEVFASRIWVSSAEHSYGIPLPPEQLNGVKSFDFAVLGAVLAWILSGKERADLRGQE